MKTRIGAMFLWVAACGLALTLAQSPIPPAEAEYVRWLEERSMLFQAGDQSKHISGRGVQWRHPYAEPRPRDIVRQSSVWLLDYPGSVITRKGTSVIGTWGDPALWDTLRDLGIDLLHTGPLKRAGGVTGRDYTPTIDGWFDRISLELDPALGTEEEYRRMVKVAGERGGGIAGDLVPLHTGLGADFRLAQRAYKDYPGMFTMVEIRRPDWPLLPKLDSAWAVDHLPKDAAEALVKKGYLPGLINSNDAAEGAKNWSGWSATGEVVGVDGQGRRWVYLHYFKPAQPALNWLDPSYAARRATAGDVVKTIHTLGAKGVRLDAVPFLGIEPQPGKQKSLHYLHPLSVNGTNDLAFLIRKLGGWSFQELNVPLVELKRFTQNGPDLSYNFFTRAQYLHALLTGDATLLRQSYGMLLEAGIPLVSLVHDLQNHDEITYQLTELAHRGDQLFIYSGERLTGKALKEKVIGEMRARTAGEAAPHNKLYRPEKDGLATTFAAFIAAAHGIRDPYQATPEQVEAIKRSHLLLAHANAMQPGVFSLSSWDLVGALPIPLSTVEDRAKDGDYRWVNRGGVDLMGANADAQASAFGLQRAKALYGSVPDQMKDPASFASSLKKLLAARKKYQLAEGELLAAVELPTPAVCVLVMRLPGRNGVAITALNFGRSDVTEEIDLAAVPGVALAAIRGRATTDIVTEAEAGQVTESGRIRIAVAGRAGRTLVVLGP